MPPLVTQPPDLVYDFPVATIEVKTNLDLPAWTPLAHFYCDRLTLAVNAYDEALISHELGDVMQPGTSAFASYQPQALLGKYVRLTIPQPAPRTQLRWVGYIVATANERSAVKTEGVDKVLTGRKQVVRAVGLEYFLDRRQIDSARIYNPDDPDEPVTIRRSIAFNKGQSRTDSDSLTRPNRSPHGVAHPNVTVYEFAAHGDTPELWTTARVINYLLHYYQPVNTAGQHEPTQFLFDSQDQLDKMVDGVSPTLDPDGLTVFECLNKLLSTQRGFLWWLEFDEPTPTTHRARIRVETIVNDLTVLPSFGTEPSIPTFGVIPANRDQQTLDLETQRDIEDFVVKEFGSRVYDQVIARGSRMTSTVTLAIRDDELAYEELVIDWTEELQTEYDFGVDSGDVTAEQNDAFRAAERFYRVYNAFRVSPDWDGKSGDGDEAERNWSFPQLSDTGSIADTLEFNVDGIKLLNHTRLKRGWNYEDADNIEETTPAGTEPEYMPVFAIVKVADGVEEEETVHPDKYQFVDKLSRSGFEEDSTPVTGDISTSYHVSAQHSVPGILLRPTNGINHKIALNHWNSEANLTAHEPEVDYATLRLTCTLEADAFCEGRYPEDEDLPDGVPLQSLIIYLGDEYRLDFLAANTVVDLGDGEPVLTTGGILRDDRRQLRDVAQLAYEWHRENRQPVSITFRQIMNVFRLGMLITTIGVETPQVDVNTVVSTITFDFLQGTTTIQTSDQGLDVASLV